MNKIYLVTRHGVDWGPYNGYMTDVPSESFDIHSAWKTKEEANAIAKKLDAKAKIYFYRIKKLKIKPTLL
jgi:hypothetical protein